jgi:hypothetical protein
MASKTVTQLIDDLDGTEITDGATVTFAHQGISYEIDLGPLNAQKLYDALAPFIAAGRRVGGRRSSDAPAATASSGAEREQLQAIREWGRQNGFTVNERGRVSKELNEAYHAAQ